MLLCESLYDPFAGVEVAVLVAAVAGDGGRLVGGQATQVVDGGVDRGERGMGGGQGGALAEEGVVGGDQLMAGSARSCRRSRDEGHAAPQPRAMATRG